MQKIQFWFPWRREFPLNLQRQWHCIIQDKNTNKNAFQKDAYRPRIDRRGGGGGWVGASQKKFWEKKIWKKKRKKIWRPPPKNWRPPLLTESQTRVKILPWPNFVAAGKNTTSTCTNYTWLPHSEVICDLGRKGKGKVLNTCRVKCF